MESWADVPSSWWVNNIGSAARATTPSGSVPQYGLATSIGTANGWDAKSFNTFLQDQQARSGAAQVQSAEVADFRQKTIAKYNTTHDDKKTWFENLKGGTWDKIQSGLTNVTLEANQLFGGVSAGGATSTDEAYQMHRAEFEAAGIDQELWNQLSDGGKDRALYDQGAGKLMAAPIVKPALIGMGAAYEGITNTLETPFWMVRRGYQGQNPLDIHKAWNAAEDNTPTQSLLDSFMWWYSDQDLDRLKRTNNFYQMTAFAGDLTLSFYADPVVLGAKAGGTAAAISKGYLPVKGKSAVGALKALQAEVPAEVAYQGGVRQRAGMWRGKRIAQTFPELRDAAQTMDLTDFQNLPMFRRHADTNGGGAAYAFHYAAQDDNLWDLTRRAVFGDSKAWNEIRSLKEGNQEILGKYQGSDPQTYIDALDATKTNFKTLQTEVDDLTKTLNKQASTVPADGSHFRHYDWTLDRSLADKQADLADVTGRLDKYEGYRSWLDNVPALSRDDQGLVNPAFLGQVSVRPEKLNFLSRRTYQANPYGAAHTIHSTTKAGWIKEAGMVDLKRVGSNTESTMRYFESLSHNLNYVDREGLNAALDKVGKSYDEQGRWDALRQIEDTHLPKALGQHFGLEEDTVLTFMDKLRGKQDEMLNGLATGEGAVYSTAPSMLESSSVKLVQRDAEYSHIQVMDGGKKVSYKVPNDALDIRNQAVDPTQTPKFYQPLSVRELKLAMRRDADLFKELETAGKNRGREYMGILMDDIDKYGGRWNQFWKPLQLFRLGWPQRVLMDESIRGMVQLGMGPWLKTYGRSYRTTAINAINPKLHGPLAAFERRQSIKIGPGPLSDEVTGRFNDVPTHDEIFQGAPAVPESWDSPVNKVRAANLDTIIAHDSEVMANASKYEAIRDSLNSLYGEDLSGVAGSAVREHIAALEAEANNIGLIKSGSPWVKVHDNLKDKTLKFFGDNPGESRRWVGFDPLTGNQLRNGIAVPVTTSQGSYLTEEALAGFLKENRDLLATGNYRVVAEAHDDFHQAKPRVQYHVVRVFHNHETKQAAEFLQHTEGDFMLNMRKSGQKLFARQWDDKTPVTEFMNRPSYAYGEETAFQPGTSPAEGVPPVFHGTGSELPPDLRPRNEVPAVLGNMVGKGFYTTVDHTVASEYAGDVGHLYTIRGSKSRKTYDVFDVDQTISPEDKSALLDAIHSEYPHFHEASTDGTWLDAISSTEYEPAVQKLITKFLEERKNAGALTHKGGSFVGNRAHQVYVWLHPEDLMVRPAYDKTGKFHLLEDWMSHPNARESIVPENRIIRTGKRDAELRELETIHKERVAFEAANPNYAYLGNAEHDKLLKLEINLMHRNGLDYTHNLTRERAFTPPGFRADRMDGKSEHWYTKVKPGVREDANARAPQEAAARASIARNLNVQESEFGMHNLDFSSWDSEHGAFIRKLLKKRSAGEGFMKMKSADGESIVVPRATEGVGESYIGLMSSSPAYAKLTDTYKRTLSKYRTKAIGYKRLQPPDMSPEALGSRGGLSAAKEYYTSWSDLLNGQVRNSPIWYKMLEGKSNDQIVNWLRNTPEGARVRRALPHKGQHPEHWVEEHRWELDNYLPNKDMQKALAGARVTPSELRKGVPPEDMPTVAAEDLELLNGTGIGEMWGKTAEKIYHALGTVPTDVLNRQPFFNGMYNLKMKNLVGAHEGAVTNADIAAYSKLSREFGLTQVRKTMFDLMDDTNMTKALRFVAPFWGAQFEALEKWFRMVITKPETLARFYVGLNQVYDRMTVINSEGQPQKFDPSRGILGYNANDRIVLQIPNNLKKIAPFDKMLKEFGSVDFSFGSANTALQGENWLLPSLGPIATVPANQLVNMMWDTHGVEHDKNWLYNWFFPVGRPNGSAFDQILSQTAPGWGKRAVAWGQENDSRMYASTYWSVYRELEYDHKKRGLPEPTPDEIKSAVDWHMGLRVAGAFALPVSLNFRPKHQFFLDEYHKMIQTDGPGPAFENFVKKYGADAAYFAASQSSSVGVPSTAKGMTEWSQNKDLIQQTIEKAGGNSDKSWASAIISPDAWADDFSSDAYGQQFDIKVGPGTSQTLRESTDPAVRKAKTDTRVGWLEYRQFMDAINAQLYAQGMTSLEQNGAEELKAMKQAFVADLASRNDAWIKDFYSFDSTIYQRVGELAQIVAKPQFDKRPDLLGVRQYLMIRQQVATYLDASAAQGGSRSLQSKDNAEVRNYFYSQVGALIQSNPSFGEFYSRWLETDRLERGSGP